MPSLKLSNPFRRGADRPSLRERAAALKATASRVLRRVPVEADQGRRAMVAGSLAAALPLPALAAIPASKGEDPDAAVMAAGGRYERALAAEAKWGAAFDDAWPIMRAALDTCPPEAVVSHEDRFMILGGYRWPTAFGGNLRHLPADSKGGGCSAWTPILIRAAISQAVPKLGTGGQTPHHIRRWNTMLPAIDAFEARAKAAEAATNYITIQGGLTAARKEVRDSIWALRDLIACTPEGLAFVVRVAAIDMARGCKPSPNLLHSTAQVVGVDLGAVRKPLPGTLD